MPDDVAAILIDDRYPGWRARVIHDEYAGEPDGDALAPALAPALVTAGGATPYFAKGVYVPQAATKILAAWPHLGRDLFERYLRMFHGVTTIAVASNRDTDVWCFDTTDFRRHVGIATTPANLAGERAEWQAWLDGDVYGVVVERLRAGTTAWDDGTTTAAEQWLEVESVWGMYGHANAEEEAAALLHNAAA